MSARRSSDRADFQEQKIVPVRCGVIPTRRNKMPIKTDDPAALEKLDAKLNALHQTAGDDEGSQCHRPEQPQ